MSISVVGSSAASALQSVGTQRKRPEAAEVAAQVYAQLDVAGKGYVDSNDLTAALGSSGDSASAKSLFDTMDGDSDGKVTEKELATLLQKVTDQFEDSFAAARVGQAMGSRPPPPPSGGGGDKGMTAEELGAVAEDAEASGSAQASDLAALVESFDEADTDEDGKVSFQEAMAFREASASAASADEDSSASRSVASGEAGRDERMLARVLDMLSKYSADSVSASTSSGLSALA
ncbi:EF-hand domain-containing protein [Methyloversatilis sp.]|uniref:EF-hand domain-containing protein n=1 Tax=Methyloversatilis sp. TaxID=2569862 RepID=UPI0027377AF4|nr:EF-hand domain-containing protein [Methyloversatilis sp.]MDP2869263.1 EF-hand domain-containing protein [Methyloversatilis sp.]MDP3287172.1 EF-hand domain-containing protein [Methyloversatilis sp.]MDP3454733.1 EF-hand domain-containing protein [Methyloversatilis sp.]MDP3577041.1 EF-hand domain-containing protein [Methyloversatilis sp.]